MYVEVKFKRSEKTLRKAALEGRGLEKFATQRFELPVPSVLSDVSRFTDKNSFSLGGNQNPWRQEIDQDGIYYHQGWLSTEDSIIEAKDEFLTLDEAVSFALAFVCTDEMKAANELHKEIRQRRIENENAKAAEKRRLQDEGIMRERAAEEARTEKLCVWAKQYGSELLKKRIAGDFEWIPLAHKEFAQSVINSCVVTSDLEKAPDGGDSDERTRPTLEEIEILEKVKAEIGKRGIARLLWVTYVDDEGEKTHRCELAVDIKTPDSKKTTLYFSLL